MIKRLRHTAKVGALMTVAAAGLLVGGASPAMADTSEATANAATLELAGNPLITTGTCEVFHESNQSLPAEECPNENPVLPGQSVLSLGLLAQTATANPGAPPDGTPATSSACAGVVGGDGSVQIGPGGGCEFTTGAPDGVIIDLGTLGRITADAIIAECTATSVPQGGTTAVTLVNAELQLLVAGIPTGDPIPLDSTPTPNTPVVAAGGLISIVLNQQPPGPPAPPLEAGQVGTTALDVQVLGALGGDPLIHLTLGTVTCGPNVVAADIPVIPLEGLPIALATVAGAGVVALVIHRRRRLAADRAA